MISKLSGAAEDIRHLTELKSYLSTMGCFESSKAIGGTKGSMEICNRLLLIFFSLPFYVNIISPYSLGQLEACLVG